MLLFLDTETTGLPDFNLPITHPSQPHIVQIAAWLGEPPVGRDYAPMLECRHVASLNAVIRPSGWEVGAHAERIHGISTRYALAFGEDLAHTLRRFFEMVKLADDKENGCSGTLIAHNLPFDHRMLTADAARAGLDATPLGLLKPFCTMRALTPRMRLPGKWPGKYKWPNLTEAHRFCFPDTADFDNKHTAMGDLLACKDIYLHGLTEGWWT